jgi:ABC-2 type transport system ATP-binding protein
LLKLDNLSKFYNKNQVLHSINYVFDQTRYCIVGAAGLETPTAGNITFNHKPVNSVECKKQQGISSDKIILPDFLTANQLLELHCQQNACPFPSILIDKLNFSLQLSTPVSALSLGNLKKISLLLALAHKPTILLLDEPTTGLDEKSRTWLLDYFQQYRGQIIITSHEDCFIKNKQYQQVAISALNNCMTTNNMTDHN